MSGARRQSGHALSKHAPPSSTHFPHGPEYSAWLPPEYFLRATNVVITGGSQSVHFGGLAGFPDDFFNGAIIEAVVCTNITKGETNIIDDYHDTGEFDTDTDWSSGNPAIGDKFRIYFPGAIGSKGMLEVIETDPTGFPDYTTGQAAAGIICTADGDVVIDNILWSVKDASLGAVTDIALSTNNADPEGRKQSPVMEDPVAAFARYIQFSILGGSVNHSFPITLEDGKSLYIHGGTVDGATAITGAATITFTIMYTRKTAGASLSSALA